MANLDLCLRFGLSPTEGMPIKPGEKYTAADQAEYDRFIERNEATPWGAATTEPEVTESRKSRARETR